jgi:uncharacterized protein YndB with AHSA1/START domain
MARELNGEVLIEASKERVWVALSDFGNTYLWNPAVEYSHSTSEAPGGVGATRHCDLNISKASIEERVVDWVEDEGMRVEIFDGRRTPPFKEAWGKITLAEAPDGGGTLTKMQIHYDLKYGILGGVIDRLMVRTQYGKGLKLALAGLKYHVETGKLVEKGTRVPVDEVSLTTA